MAGLIEMALILTAAGSMALAGFLWVKARAVEGALPLAAFLGLVALWSCGLLLPGPAGLRLMALAPPAAAAFLHLALCLTGRPARHALPGWIAAIAASLWGMNTPIGSYQQDADGLMLFRYTGAGLGLVLLTALLSAAGHLLLADGFRRSRGLNRRRLGLLLAASLLGAVASLPIAGPLATSLPGPIWQIPDGLLLALPLYCALLTFGLLRYKLLAINLWARRALIWGLLTLAVALTTALLSGILATGNGPPAVGLAVLLTLLLAGPAGRLADRLIFPGGEVSARHLAGWRAALAEAPDEAGLDRTAAALLHQHLNLPPETAADLSAAPPGPRRAAALLADLTQEARLALRRRQALADQARLAELGALAATIAHDLRNPLNILTMAVADCPPAVQQDVRQQVRRMERLVRDLLDYAKPWSVMPEQLDAAALIADCARALPPDVTLTVDLPPGLTLRADPLRLLQALGNLLSNAASAGRHLLITADRAPDALELHVCDDGPGIPADIRDNLFQPFISRQTAGGTGLGLAIAARVMTAHGGSLRLGHRPGWTTCFTLRFPA